MTEEGVRSSQVVSDCYLAQWLPPHTIQPVEVEGYYHPLREGDGIQGKMLPTKAYFPQHSPLVQASLQESGQCASADLPQFT